MAPPPVVSCPTTPPPHRFLTTTKLHQRVQRSNNISSSDRQPQLPPSSQQFNPTPRFIFSTPAVAESHARKDGSNGRGAFTDLSSPLVARRIKKVDRREEEVIESSSDVEPDAGEVNRVRRRTLKYDPILPTSEDNDVALESAPKRRRISQLLQESIEDEIKQHRDVLLEYGEKGESDGSPTESDIEPELQPTLRPSASHSRFSQHPRFIFPTTSHASSASPPGTATITSYARSLRPRSPPPSHLANEEAVLLSPHKRGKDRYVPGGLAAQLRDWAVQAITSFGSVTGDEIIETVDVGETRGDGGAGHMLMLRGRRGEEEVKVLLVGAGGPWEGLSGGVVVGLKGPVWDIELEGETWRVGVEWRAVGN